VSLLASRHLIEIPFGLDRSPLADIVAPVSISGATIGGSLD
jgi:hypothetical protein